MIAIVGRDGARNTVTTQGMYSDGMPFVKMDNWEHISSNAETIVYQHRNLTEFVVAVLLGDITSASKMVMPYFPGARQDRSNPGGDVLDTARSIGRMLTDAGPFSDILVLDPHSPVVVDCTRWSPNPLSVLAREYPLERIAKQMWHGYDAIISPDKGAVDRAGVFADTIGLPLVTASKMRDVSNGRLSGFEVEVESGKNYLVVDDICDGGGTFVGLGEKIAEQGASADLYVTHGIFSKGTRELKKYYRNIYTTDSKEMGDHLSGVHIIPVVEDMIDYVH